MLLSVDFGARGMASEKDNEPGRRWLTVVIAAVAFLAVSLVMLVIALFAESSAWIWVSIASAAAALACVEIGRRRARALEDSGPRKEDLDEEELPPSAKGSQSLSAAPDASDDSSDEDAGDSADETDGEPRSA
jgi:hypothetical protein